MPFIRNCTAAVLAALVVVNASGQTTAPVEGPAEFLIFAGTKEVGRQQVNVSRSGGNWVITSSGRMGAPIEMDVNRFEVKYAADWQPLELHIEATAGGRPMALSTSFGMTTAINEITRGDTTNSKTDQISARTIVLPNGFFAGYEAVAARLASTPAPTELSMYVAPQAEVKAFVKSVRQDTLTSPAGAVQVRSFDLSVENPGGPLQITVAVDGSNRLARVDIPSGGLSVVRSDLASVLTRQQSARNPTDVDATIPASGFNIAATLTMPPQVAGRLRHPAVILIGGSGPIERDSRVAGIPIFAQLAGALAERGYLVVRYDKRGVGQSGGRTERATIQDYAEDALSVYRWVERRKDVDKRNIALAGHSEGGAVAMIAAGRERDISSLVLIAAPGTRGAELVLEQQRLGLDALNTTDDDRKAKVDLQQRIHTAVLTGIGWDGVPADLRRRAETPWFRSLLEFDPSRAMERIRQPVLIIQGDLDRQVPAHHGDKLAAMARARKRQAAVDVVHLPGVNHLLVRATTGHVSEYPQLQEKTIVPDVARKIADFLKR